MADDLQHLGSFIRFIATRGQRTRHDQAVQSELLKKTLPLPKGLELQWLGTAGYRIGYQGQSIYIDPYFSRVPLGAVLQRKPSLPDAAVLDRVLSGVTDQVVGVLVGHCHFDHAIDAPEIARRYNAPAYGSKSLVNLMALHGLRHLAKEVEPRKAYEIGPFTVRFIRSEHSKLALGHSVPNDGELTCEHLDALSPAAYRCGQVWAILIEVAGIKIYHQGSANLIDEEVPTGGVDIFLAGIAGRRFTKDYWQRVLRRLEPKWIVASHFDDFFKPIDAPMGFSMNVNLAAFPEEVGKVSRDFSLATLEPMRTVRG